MTDPVPFWTVLADLLVIVGAALVLGLLARRLGMPPMVGALVAGALVGPSGLHIVADRTVVATLAELGVSLLLFDVGLEFSLPELRRLGRAAVVGGGAQIALTGAATGGLALLLGRPLAFSVTLASLAALSSTAAVISVLRTRGELDAVHGRGAVGVLLVQDLALVPLLLLVDGVAGGGTPVQALASVVRSLVLLTVLVIAFWLIANRLVPRLTGLLGGGENRELAVLVAVCTGVGSAWLAHALGLSPAIGAFVAGILLAESPLALQLRVDVAPAGALFMTLFFASVGMLTDLRWIAANLPTVLLTAVALVLGKTIVAGTALRLAGLPWRHALAAGLCVSQLGEFSFVVADTGRVAGALSGGTFQLVVAVLVIAFLATPALVALAAHTVVAPRGAAGAGRGAPERERAGHLVLVGYGPAGAAVVARARAEGVHAVVVEMNPRLAAAVRSSGAELVVGDASHLEVLRAARVGGAALAVVTVPDGRAAQRIVAQLRRLAPELRISARARQRAFAADLARAGADTVIDEEAEVGTRLADVISACTAFVARRSDGGAQP